jgi:hypothetical protein
MTRRWRPPPYWPPPPSPDWTPPPDWRPDPSWPPPPPGWQFWESKPSRAPYWAGLAVLTVVGLAVAGSLSDDGTTVADGAPAGAVETASTSAPATTPPDEAAAAAAPVEEASGEAASEPASEPTRARRTTKPKPKRTSVPTTTRPKPKKTRKPPARQCDPNYAGGCVPIASDVDCAGGSGNGPAYFDGPADVVGDDVYGLDSDHDGIACES